MSYVQQDAKSEHGLFLACSALRLFQSAMVSIIVTRPKAVEVAHGARAA